MKLSSFLKDRIISIFLIIIVVATITVFLLATEVDLFIKIDEYDYLWDKIEKLIKENIVEESKTNTSNKITEIRPLPMPRCEEFLDRVITTGENIAYLKIGEGCSNRCTYCAIPYIRGPFVSRPMEDIIEEAKLLAKKGIKELIVIAQDTTKYGLDLYQKPMLAKVLKEICKIDGIEWVRFLYSYPEGITDELIEVVKNEPKICKYFDIPIQHISNSVLKRMNRKTTKENIKDVINKIRTNIPEVTIRTTVMVGFPGETKEDFEELYDFVKETKFDKLGAFTYSKEEGTPAARLKEQIHPLTKKARYRKIMEEQQKVSENNLKQIIGKEIKVLVEDKTFDEKYYIARSQNEVPDIDGLIYIKNSKDVELGTFIKCTIIDSREYDLIAEIRN